MYKLNSSNPHAIHVRLGYTSLLFGELPLSLSSVNCGDVIVMVMMVECRSWCWHYRIISTGINLRFGRSEWLHGLRNEMSSPAQTLGSRVRIPLEVCMSAFILFVLSCVGRCLATGWSLVQGVLSIVCIGFEVLTEVVMKSTIFWDITPCSPLSVNRRFGETYRLHLQGRKNKLSKKSAWKLATCFHAGFLLSLFFDPEDGGHMFLRNFGLQSQKMVPICL
jgi:hypothetical protein